MDTTIKFYQTGTFTVGNRLLTEDQRSVQATQGAARTRSIPATVRVRAAAKRWERATRSTRRCKRPTTS